MAESLKARAEGDIAKADRLERQAQRVGLPVLEFLDRYRARNPHE
jgi:hypothetical protein